MTREDFLAQLAAQLDLRRKEDRAGMARVVDAALPLVATIIRPHLDKSWEGNKVFEALDRLKPRNGASNV